MKVSNVNVQCVRRDELQYEGAFSAHKNVVFACSVSVFHFRVCVDNALFECFKYSVYLLVDVPVLFKYV